jgi:hypothetical protein
LLLRRLLLLPRRLLLLLLLLLLPIGAASCPTHCSLWGCGSHMRRLHSRCTQDAHCNAFCLL